MYQAWQWPAGATNYGQASNAAGAANATPSTTGTWPAYGQYAVPASTVQQQWGWTGQYGYPANMQSTPQTMPVTTAYGWPNTTTTQSAPPLPSDNPPLPPDDSKNVASKPKEVGTKDFAVDEKMKQLQAQAQQWTTQQATSGQPWGMSPAASAAAMSGSLTTAAMSMQPPTQAGAQWPQAGWNQTNWTAGQWPSQQQQQSPQQWPQAWIQQQPSATKPNELSAKPAESVGTTEQQKDKLDGTADFDTEEEEFDRQFQEWEKQFETWKEQNINHPDKEAFSNYEKQWQVWREELLQKKQEMVKKREMKKQSMSLPSTATTQAESKSTSIPGLDLQEDKQPGRLPASNAQLPPASNDSSFFRNVGAPQGGVPPQSYAPFMSQQNVPLPPHSLQQQQSNQQSSYGFQGNMQPQGPGGPPMGGPGMNHPSLQQTSLDGLPAKKPLLSIPSAGGGVGGLLPHPGTRPGSRPMGFHEMNEGPPNMTQDEGRFNQMRNQDQLPSEMEGPPFQENWNFPEQTRAPVNAPRGRGRGKGRGRGRGGSRWTEPNEPDRTFDNNMEKMGFEGNVDSSRNFDRPMPPNFDGPMDPAAGFEGNMNPPRDFDGNMRPDRGFPGDMDRPGGFKGNMDPGRDFEGNIGPNRRFEGDMGPQRGFDRGMGPQRGFEGNPMQGRFEEDIHPMRGGFDGNMGPNRGFNENMGPGPGRCFDENMGPGPGRGFNENMGPKRGFSENMGSKRGFNDNMGTKRGFNDNMGPKRGFPENMGPNRGFHENMGPNRGFHENMGSNRGFHENMGPNRGFPEDMGPNRGFPEDVGPNRCFPDIMGPNRGFPEDMGPNRGFPEDTGPNRGFPDDMGPNRGFPEDMGPDRGFPEDMGPNRGFPEDMGPNRGFPEDMGPNRGFPEDIGPNRSFDGNKRPNRGFDGNMGPDRGFDGNMGPDRGFDGNMGPDRGFDAKVPSRSFDNMGPHRGLEGNVGKQREDNRQSFDGPPRDLKPEMISPKDIEGNMEQRGFEGGKNPPRGFGGMKPPRGFEGSMNSPQAFDDAQKTFDRNKSKQNMDRGMGPPGPEGMNREFQDSKPMRGFDGSKQPPDMRDRNKPPSKKEAMDSDAFDPEACLMSTRFPCPDERGPDGIDFTSDDPEKGHFAPSNVMFNKDNKCPQEGRPSPQDKGQKGDQFGPRGKRPFNDSFEPNFPQPPFKGRGRFPGKQFRDMEPPPMRGERFPPEPFAHNEMMMQPPMCEQPFPSHFPPDEPFPFRHPDDRRHFEFMDEFHGRPCDQPDFVEPPPFRDHGFIDALGSNSIDYSHRSASSIVGEEFRHKYDAFDTQFGSDIINYRESNYMGYIPPPPPPNALSQSDVKVFDYSHGNKPNVSTVKGNKGTMEITENFSRHAVFDYTHRRESPVRGERGRDNFREIRDRERFRDRDQRGRDRNERDKDFEKERERDKHRPKDDRRERFEKKDRDERIKERDRAGEPKHSEEVTTTRNGSREKENSGFQRQNSDRSRDAKPSQVPSSDLFQSSSETVPMSDLLNPPHRFQRPKQLVIILRGFPGSGKSYLAKLIKEKEVQHGGSAPRILSLDDYFMAETEVSATDPETGKTVKKKEFKYEYEACMEESYRASLLRSFKKTIDDRFFPFIIVDAIHNDTKHYEPLWSYAKLRGFQVYIAEMDCQDVPTCHKRNIHNRSLDEIQKIKSKWDRKPKHYISVDVRPLLQEVAITEVEMEDSVNEEKKEDEKTKTENDDDDTDTPLTFHIPSRWEQLETEEKLDKLDGLRVSKKKHSTMEDYLQLPDDYNDRPCEPGKKRVRWADLEQRKENDRMREIGFVVGQTDWSKLTDPSQADKALTRTKYI